MTGSAQGVEQNNASSLIEQLGQALLQLEAHRVASEDKVQWMEIRQHFQNLDTTLKRKFEELEARDKEYMEKEAEIHSLLAEREDAVAAKELDFLDRMQELKDAAVAVIAEARANHQPIMLEPIDVGGSKVSSSYGDTNSLEGSPRKMGENAETVAADVRPRPELMQFCEQMDSRGLLSFALENQKILYALREELSVALDSAKEPARLVLDSQEAFYPPVETIQSMNIKDAALQGMRRSCIMIMEALATLLARKDPTADHFLNPEIKQQAKAIADAWKPKLSSAGTDATNGYSLEADAFLQLLSTFRIASEFDKEELCKLVLVIAHRRQAPELCRSLGLIHEMPDVIESLINNGKQVEAVRFIHAFQLTDAFPPVPLLKTYLKEFRRNSQGKGKTSGNAAGQADINAQELARLKAVIRCVEDYKLEADYPLDPLQRRVAQLSKSKSDKKRTGDFNRHQQSKKPRANGGYHGPRGGAAPGAAAGRQAPPAFTERAPYTGILERYPHTGPNLYEYQIPSQSAYGQPTTVQRIYYYPPVDRAPAVPDDAAAPSGYSNYMGSGMRSSQQPYM